MTTETLSIRIDSETKQKLDQLAQQTRRSKSFLAAEALRNLVSIRNYIAESSEMNATLVEARFLDCIELLENHPEIGRSGEMLDTREFAVPRTTFVVVYRVRDGGLRLLAILHGSQSRPASFQG